MRKTIFTALVVLLVMLAFASCDIGSVVGKPEYTADGRRLVTLKINVGGAAGSRALTLALAKDGANFMEVIFKSGSNYYRAEGKLPQTLTIKIPEGTYNNTNAILLIGKRTSTDNFLLATGTIVTPVNLSVDDTVIDFTIKVLKIELYAGATSPALTITTTGFPSAFTTPTDKTASGTFFDKETRCFQVPTNTADIKATLTIGDLDNSYDKIFLADGAEIKLTGSPNSKPGGGTPTPIVDATVTSPEVGEAIATFVKDGDGVITSTIPKVISFKFTTPGTAPSAKDPGGSYIITFSIPVKGFNSAATSHRTWYIRGGTKLGQVYQEEVGGEEEGAALLVTEEPFSSLKTVNVSPIDPDDWS